MIENSHDAMERVLAGLRNAEAPTGMERRILDATRNGAPKNRQWSVATPWLLAGWENWAIAVAGVVVVSSMVCWTVLREHQPENANALSKRQIMTANPVKPLVQISMPQPSPERPILRVSGKTNTRSARFVREEKFAPLHDMGAGNHPAPEAPLTEQEKLLLRLAHRTGPVEVAELNPALWAARDAAEKAEVKKFFEPSQPSESSPTGDNK